MQALKERVLKLRVLRDTSGQELVEYALVAGVLACACGAIMPDISDSVLGVFSKVVSVFNPIVGDTSGSAPTS
jgi:pilus assembly protein Flp/PilA